MYHNVRVPIKRRNVKYTTVDESLRMKITYICLQLSITVVSKPHCGIFLEHIKRIADFLYVISTGCDKETNHIGGKKVRRRSLFIKKTPKFALNPK